MIKIHVNSVKEEKSHLGITEAQVLPRHKDIICIHHPIHNTTLRYKVIEVYHLFDANNKINMIGIEVELY